MTDISILLNDLMSANERGLSPPQNWTHRSIKVIQQLEQENAELREAVDAVENKETRSVVWPHKDSKGS